MKNKKQESALNLVNTVDTTIGELVAVLSEIASSSTNSKDEQYRLVSEVLSKILSRSGKELSEIV